MALPHDLSRTFSNQLRQYSTAHTNTNQITHEQSHHSESRNYGTSASVLSDIQSSDFESVNNPRNNLRNISSRINRDEEEHLLAAQHDEEEHADSDGLYPPRCTWTNDQPEPPDRADPFQNSRCKVYENIHRVRRDIMNTFDDPYSAEQLKTPRMIIAVIRPLVDRYYNMQDLSIVYCLLINRINFLHEQAVASHHHPVNLTRALVCETLADKILRRYNEHNPGPKGLLKLANILVYGFEPFQNAPPELISSNSHIMHYVYQKKGEKFERRLTALEIAIISESKSFLASGACRKVVDAIHRGKIVYTPNSFIDIIPDHWKIRPISLYDPRRAPMLNQYRLTVPRTRNAIEVGQFVILLALYLAVMARRESRQNTDYNWLEIVFDIYGAGWLLDQFASVLEHGWRVYTQNMWAFLDVVFSIVFLAYLIPRLHAFSLDDKEAAQNQSRTALDILSCAAPILIPRLAFNVMSENVLLLSLREMMSDFFTLTALAFWSFAGILLTLKWLHNGVHHAVTIGKWMIWIWFGLDGTGIERSTDFHPILGPAMMISFAFLGNTLFLTILVSMLSNTFSVIVGNAVQEIQYRRAVLTFEAVKSDAIFSYMPPFNIPALLILLPLKMILSPRIFHKTHVAAVRVLNFPLLFAISWYERRALWMSDRHKRFMPRKIDWMSGYRPKPWHLAWWVEKMAFWEFSKFSVHGDAHAVFEIEPPQSLLAAIAEADEHPDADGFGKVLHSNFHNQFTTEKDSRKSQSHRRRSSMMPKISRQMTGRSNRSLEWIRNQRKDSQASIALRKEFRDSSDEDDGDNTLSRTKSRQLSVDSEDSVNDFSANKALEEANSKLKKMNESVKKLEMMVGALLEANKGAGSVRSDEEDEAENELQEEIREGTAMRGANG